MYEKFPEFQTLRPGHYAVFTGKIIQREDCAGSIRSRGPPYPAPARKEHGGRHAAPPPRRAEATPPAHPGSANRYRMRPASDRGSRFLESIRSSPRAALVRAPGITASVPQAGVRHRRSVHPPQKKKASRDPATPCTPPSTPPNANRAPRAGPPRGCAPWQRGARGQGSSR